MNLHLLRTFAAVAEHQSFSRAAEAIHVSQPAVSKSVRELEQQLGLALLERQGGRVQLTEAGAALYDHARAIFALERAAEADIRERLQLGRGCLTVGASMTIASFMLPPLIAEYLQRYPSIDVRIISGNTGTIEQQVLDHELDVGLVEGPVEDARLERTLWREDELVVVAAADYPLPRDVTPAELAEHRWMVREEGSGTRAVTMPLLEQAGIKVKNLMEVGSIGALVESVAAGLGLAMISVEAVRDPLRLGRLRTVDVPSVRFIRPLHRICLRNRPISPAVAAFTELIDAQRTTVSRE